MPRVLTKVMSRNGPMDLTLPGTQELLPAISLVPHNRSHLTPVVVATQDTSRLARAPHLIPVTLLQVEIP
jgi:hypothetical protein